MMSKREVGEEGGGLRMALLEEKGGGEGKGESLN